MCFKLCVQVVTVADNDVCGREVGRNDACGHGVHKGSEERQARGSPRRLQVRRELCKRQALDNRLTRAGTDVRDVTGGAVSAFATAHAAPSGRAERCWVRVPVAAQRSGNAGVRVCECVVVPAGVPVR